MYENLRVFFSIVWLVATGCLLASLLAFAVTWGDFREYLIASIAIWCIASFGAVYTSLL